MKKLLIEYSNIIAYAVTGLVFGFGFFLLFLNFYHYRDVNEAYVKQDTEMKIGQELKNKLSLVTENTSGFDMNTYRGSEDPYSLSSVKSRLDICTKKINTEEFDTLISKKNIDMKDIYDMQQFYQVQISNECLVKQLYEISLTENNKLNITSLPTVAPFFENQINQLINSTDYVQKVIKNNSSYYFNSEISKVDIYNPVKDSYYSILNNYVSSINFIYDLSVWYKNVVGGV